MGIPFTIRMKMTCSHGPLWLEGEESHSGSNTPISMSGPVKETVSLTGEVPDLSTSAHATWMAWKTPGVKAVQNDLTILEQKNMGCPTPRS